MLKRLSSAKFQQTVRSFTKKRSTRIMVLQQKQQNFFNDHWWPPDVSSREGTRHHVWCLEGDGGKCRGGGGVVLWGPIHHRQLSYWTLLPWTHRCLWKHYVLTTLFVGGNKPLHCDCEIEFEIFGQASAKSGVSCQKSKNVNNKTSMHSSSWGCGSGSGSTYRGVCL